MTDFFIQVNDRQYVHVSQIVAVITDEKGTPTDVFTTLVLGTRAWTAKVDPKYAKEVARLLLGRS